MNRMFEQFDFNLLNDPNFKEDAVREDIIVPILSRLGYSASGENKIIRSKSLIHPYVYFGTGSKKITIIPDYTLQVGNVNRVILDAKAPGQEVHSGKNVQQAYSYAFHPEIKAELFALCNGKELTIFSVQDLKQVLVVDITKIDECWPDIERKISPLAFSHPHIFSFHPDFGIHLFRLGIEKEHENFFAGFWINSIAKIENDKYSLMSNLLIENQTFFASFDFDVKLYESLLAILPDNRKNTVQEGLSRFPFFLHFSGKSESMFISVKAHLQGELIESKKQIFMPFIVTEFIKKENVSE